MCCHFSLICAVFLLFIVKHLFEVVGRFGAFEVDSRLACESRLAPCFSDSLRVAARDTIGMASEVAELFGETL